MAFIVPTLGFRLSRLRDVKQYNLTHSLLPFVAFLSQQQQTCSHEHDESKHGKTRLSLFA